MRLINVNTLSGHEVLKMPIRNGQGAILLPAGAIVTETFKSRLKKIGITRVYIEDDKFKDVEAIPALDPDTKSKAIQTLSSVFQAHRAGRGVDANAVRDLGSTIYDNVCKVSNMPINLFDMYAIENEKVLHCINVATMVSALGAALDMKHSSVKDLVTGALLHDIYLETMYGEETKSHATQAHEALKTNHSFSTLTYMAVAMHHENYNGSGFPYRFAGDKIYEGARLLAICDAYDNLINGYSGKDKLSQYYALEYINANAGTLYDPNFVLEFNKTIAIYPNGSAVKLNSGESAVVIMQNAKMPSRPVVRMLRDIEGLYYEINLLTSRTVFIEEMDI